MRFKESAIFNSKFVLIRLGSEVMFKISMFFPTRELSHVAFQSPPIIISLLPIVVISISVLVALVGLGSSCRSW